VPFWPGLRCSRTVARAGGPAGGLEEARYGGPMGLGSWTTDADLHRRPSDGTAYETGSSLNTLGMWSLAI
jgi:hypothetical protein